MKYGVNAPLEEANDTFPSVSFLEGPPPPPPPFGPRGSSVDRRRDLILQRCRGVQRSIASEREATGLLLSRMQLRVTALKRQAKLQASIVDEKAHPSVGGAVVGSYRKADMLVGMLEDTLNGSVDRATQERAMDAALQAGSEDRSHVAAAAAATPRPCRTRFYPDRYKNATSDPHRFPLDLPCEYGRRRAPPQAAPPADVAEAEAAAAAAAARPGKKVFPAPPLVPEESGVPGADPALCAHRACIRTGCYPQGAADTIEGVLPMPHMMPHRQEPTAAGKRVTRRRGAAVHPHKRQDLPTSVFDATPQGCVLRSASGSIDHRTAATKRAPAQPPPPPPPVPKLPPAPSRRLIPKAALAERVPQPPSVPQLPQAHGRGRVHAVSGSHNVLVQSYAG